MSKINNFEMVDLDLPSGLKWANHNIGASSEEECGKYFQWGSVEGFEDASHSSWDSCPFNNGSESYDMGYFSRVSNDVCPNKTLKNEFDVAYVEDAQLHIPSVDDFKELYKNTINEVAEVNGISGVKFISKNDESKFIFLPYGGCAINGEFVGKGTNGNYWSCTIKNMSSDLARSMCFNEEGITASGNSSRSYAFSIRPVSK